MGPKINLNTRKIRLLDIKQVWFLIPENKKGKATVLFSLMILGMIFEMIGIGLVLPVITIITRPELVSHEFISPSLIEFAKDMSQAELMAWGMLILVVIYSLKNLYLMYLAWQQSSFVYSTQAEMAKKLFKLYLHQPYPFHLQRNSADLINNLQVELNLFMNYTLNPGMLLLAESMVILGLISLLFYFEPIGSMAVFSMFLLVGFGFQKLIKKRILYWGKKRQEHEALRMKHAQQGIGAIKDVKISGKEAFFIGEYEKSTDESLSMHQKNSFIQNATRLWLEVLAIAGLTFLCVGMFLQDKTASEILPVLALFGAVSFRLMPSANRIISAINLLRFGTSVTDLMSREFSKLQPFKKVTDAAEPFLLNESIEFVNVSYQYPTASRRTLDKVSFDIKKGEMVGFVGASGAGKSTLIDLIMGLLHPDEGFIAVDDKKVEEPFIRKWQGLIGYVPQSIYLTDDTLKRNIAFGLEDDEINLSALENAIKSAQLDLLVAELKDGVNTRLGERGVRLSGGQKQRIGIARALYHEPEILILDEATSALDAETEAEVMKSITLLQGEKTILVVAHRLSTLEKANKIINLSSDGLKIIN